MTIELFLLNYGAKSLILGIIGLCSFLLFRLPAVRKRVSSATRYGVFCCCYVRC